MTTDACLSCSHPFDAHAGGEDCARCDCTWFDTIGPDVEAMARLWQAGYQMSDVARSGGISTQRATFLVHRFFRSQS